MLCCCADCLCVSLCLCVCLGVFISRGKEDALVTKNMVVGESVYGEKRISVDVRSRSFLLCTWKHDVISVLWSEEIYIVVFIVNPDAFVLFAPVRKSGVFLKTMAIAGVRMRLRQGPTVSVFSPWSEFQKGKVRLTVTWVAFCLNSHMLHVSSKIKGGGCLFMYYLFICFFAFAYSAGSPRSSSFLQEEAQMKCFCFFP